MAGKAGIYDVMWTPVEHGFFYARDIIPKLFEGINRLRAKPNKFKKYNPANNYGDYDSLLSVAEELLRKCKEYPHAKIKTNR